MGKKFWIAFIAVYVALAITDYLIHGVILSSTYASPELSHLWRPEMMQKMWIFYLVYLFMAYAFTWIFSKGYEGKGTGEGLRYGFFVGLLTSTPMAYMSYVTYPIPYSLAMQWFLYGMVQAIVLGLVVAMVYGRPSGAPKPA